MKVGVTGARGLVGSALTRLLESEGHEVVPYSRNPQSGISGAGETRQFLPYESASTDVSGLDALVHLAGEPVLGLWTAKKKQNILSSRVEGTRGLVEAMRKYDSAPQIFVCASGSGFYGDRGDDVLTEKSDPGKGFLAEVTQAWEAAAMEAEELGIRVIRGRIGMVLGREGGAAPMLKKIFRMGLGGPLGSGKQWMPWLHVDDLARMILHVLENDEISGPVNFCAPEPVQNREFTRVIARQVKRPAIAWAPAPALKLVMRGMSDILLFSERVEPAVLQEKGFRWKYEQLEEAIRDVMGTGS